MPESAVKVTKTGRSFRYRADTVIATTFNNVTTVANGSATGGQVVTFEDSVHGSRNPGWRDQIRNHVNATTDATGRAHRSLVFQPFNVSFKQDTVGKTGNPYTLISTRGGSSGTHPALTHAFVSAPQNAINDVHATQIARGIAEIQAKKSALQTGEDFGEIRQTVRTLVNPLSTLRGSLTRYLTDLSKKRDRGSLRRMRSSVRKSFLRKTLADTYLEYNFGWQPLIRSIASSYVELQQQGNRRKYEPFEVTTRKTYQSLDTETLVTMGLPGQLIFGVIQTSEYIERWKGEVMSGANDEGRISNAQLFGLTPDRWLPTVWNLLPYSWVIDYFTNIGDLVTAATFRTSDIAWCNQTKRTVTSRRYQLRKYDFGLSFEESAFSKTYRSGSAGGGASHFEVVDWIRAPLRSDQLIPPFRFSIPGVGSKPWLNIGALLLQRASKITPYT